MALSNELAKELKERRASALEAGGKERLDKRKAKGQWSARERLDRLYTEGTFQEWGLHAQHDCHNFGMEKKKLPTDGVITGVGLVGKRPIAAFSQDFTVGGGALGRIHARKICDLMDFALQNGMPMVGFNDSGGARIQEGDESLSGYGQVFYRNVQLSGVVPQIAVISGPCAGGAAYSPALMDFLIMTKNISNMFICGPEVIKAVTGQTCTMEEIGSPMAHASVSGNIHFVAEDEADAVRLVHELLDYLPSNNVMDPPHRPAESLDLSDVTGLDDLVPENPKQPLDTSKVIAQIVDDGKFLEVQKEWAKNLLVGFARVQGYVVGIVGNQSTVKAGTLDIDASDKAARFVRFCNIFNIPIVTLVDVPGFMPGVQQERGGIIRHGAKMLFAYAAATVPKITIIMRKAYGGAYLAMCSRDMGADMVFAWPSAEIAVMGAEGATRILYRREIDAAEDPAAKAAELAADYRDKFCSPYNAASKAMITDVIRPCETRAALSLALHNTIGKREVRPPKKHGNVPL